jgi:hypothetical protein
MMPLSIQVVRHSGVVHTVSLTQQADLVANGSDGAQRVRAGSNVRTVVFEKLVRSQVADALGMAGALGGACTCWGLQRVVH